MGKPTFFLFSMAHRWLSDRRLLLSGAGRWTRWWVGAESRAVKASTVGDALQGALLTKSALIGSR